MNEFTRLRAVAAPLLRPNIDTDAIIPSREMKRVSKEGLSDGMFAPWRYTDMDKRIPDPGFVLNQPGYDHAEILLAGMNFGCGSSREHAVWALREWGIRAIIAPSFGAIFYSNCVRNGIVPVVLPLETVEDLASQVEPDPDSLRVVVDLEQCRVTAPDGAVTAFEISAADRDMLLKGLDAIDVTMQRDTEILAFQARDRERRPWIYLRT